MESNLQQTVAHLEDFKNGIEELLQPIFEVPHDQVLISHRRVEQGLITEVSQLAVGCTTAHPPIYDTPHGLEALLAAALPAAAFSHTFQRLERLRVMHWAGLDKERECAKPIGERTLG